jgi:hypothetical protein
MERHQLNDRAVPSLYLSFRCTPLNRRTAPTQRDSSIVSFLLGKTVTIMCQHFQARGLGLTRLRLLRDAAGPAGLAAEGPAHENVLWRRCALDFISVSGFPCAILLAFQLLDSVVGMIGVHSLSG